SHRRKWELLDRQASVLPPRSGGGLGVREPARVFRAQPFRQRRRYDLRSSRKAARAVRGPAKCAACRGRDSETSNHSICVRARRFHVAPATCQDNTRRSQAQTPGKTKGYTAEVAEHRAIYADPAFAAATKL